MISNIYKSFSKNLKPIGFLKLFSRNNSDPLNNAKFSNSCLKSLFAKINELSKCHHCNEFTSKDFLFIFSSKCSTILIASIGCFTGFFFVDEWVWKSAGNKFSFTTSLKAGYIFWKKNLKKSIFYNMIMNISNFLVFANKRISEICQKVVCLDLKRALKDLFSFVRSWILVEETWNDVKLCIKIQI